MSQGDWGEVNIRVQEIAGQLRPICRTLGPKKAATLKLRTLFTNSPQLAKGVFQDLRHSSAHLSRVLPKGGHQVVIQIEYHPP